MRVNPNSETSGVTGIPNRPVKQQPNLGQDETTLISADKVDRAFAQTPEVRAEKVAQAQKLVSDLSYPPQVLIKKLSALLAAHLDSTDKAG
jgi:hypothetical protein